MGWCYINKNVDLFLKSVLRIVSETKILAESMHLVWRHFGCYNTQLEQFWAQDGNRLEKCCYH